jgi:thioredoxin-like negative regulator of GroEL
MKNIIKYAIFYTLAATTVSILTCPHDSSSIVEISTTEHHKNLLNNHQGPSAVLYHMDHCKYCTAIEPIFESLSNQDQFDHVTFYTVNGPQVNAEQDVAIDGYPTIRFFNHGQVVDEQVGAAPQDVIIQKLNSLDPTKPQTKKKSPNRSK